MRRPPAAVGSAVFFLAGPGIVVGLIPWLLTGWQVREPMPYWAPIRVLGVILLVAGLITLFLAFVRFVVEGFGTPVPIAAPELLVVGGLYRYVRGDTGVHRRPGASPGPARSGAVRRSLVANLGSLRPLVRGTGSHSSVRRGLRGLPARSTRLVAPPAPLETS